MALGQVRFLRLGVTTNGWALWSVQEPAGLSACAGVRVLAQGTTGTHVLFNNCYRDNAQVNAQQLTELLRT